MSELLQGEFKSDEKEKLKNELAETKQKLLNFRKEPEYKCDCELYGFSAMTVHKK